MADRNSGSLQSAFRAVEWRTSLKDGREKKRNGKVGKLRPAHDDFNRPMIFSLVQFYHELDIWPFWRHLSRFATPSGSFRSRTYPKKVQAFSEALSAGTRAGGAGRSSRRAFPQLPSHPVRRRKKKAGKAPSDVTELVTWCPSGHVHPVTPSASAAEWRLCHPLAAFCPSTLSRQRKFPVTSSMPQRARGA